MALPLLEVVSGSNSSGSFDLPYRVTLACGIVVGDHYIVTGGWYHRAPEHALDTVAKFSLSGLVEYLPSLNTRRENHACSSFISDGGETVLLVTGGTHKPGTRTSLDSTEILETSGTSWRTLTTRLPSPRHGLRAGTANNIVFIFGGDGSTDILSFDKTEESWLPAGNMTVGRFRHAVEVINDVSQLCP